MWAPRTAAQVFSRRLGRPRLVPRRAIRQPLSRPSAQPRYPVRRFHSYDRPAASRQDDFGATEKALLSAAARHVPEHGFSPEALSLGARDAGYPDISTAILPDGVFSLVRWHLATQRETLARRSTEIFAGQHAHTTVTDKVRRLAWERLLANRVIIGRWQEALAIMAQPSCVAASLKELGLLVDDLLFLAGDVSVDSSWYTKRASLAAIYSASELFMTNDKTPGFRDTEQFLERRFAEQDSLRSKVASSGQWLGYNAAALVNVLRSKGVRI